MNIVLNNSIAMGRIKMKIVLLGVVALMLSGCGTVNTVVRDESIAGRNLKKYGTYCGSIPRVYSGVAYDFCKLHGAPNPTATTQATYAVPWIVLDVVLSGVLDTVALPYTIYRQSKDGSIDLGTSEY